MTRHRTVLACFAAALLCCGIAAGAESDKPKLKIYGDRSTPPGLWKTELLEASNPTLMANAKALSETAICMDAAAELTKKGAKGTDSSCTQAVIKNTSAEAQIEKECPGEGTTVLTMKRESKDSIYFESVERGKGGVTSMTKGRYHYVGPCSADGTLMQPDRDSEFCQRARAEAAAVDPQAECAKFEDAAKADCLSKVTARLEAGRKLCE